MKSKFEKYVLEEIEEVDEFAFYALIPRFLQQVKGVNLKGELLSDSKSNFDILETDFKDLQSIIKKLIEFEKLEVCRYYPYDGKSRREVLKPIGEKKQEQFLKDKSNWIYDKDKPAYFLCKKE